MKISNQPGTSTKQMNIVTRMSWCIQNMADSSKTTNYKSHACKRLMSAVMENRLVIPFQCCEADFFN